MKLVIRGKIRNGQVKFKGESSMNRRFSQVKLHVNSLHKKPFLETTY